MGTVAGAYAWERRRRWLAERSGRREKEREGEEEEEEEESCENFRDRDRIV
jgi:hypothetical protein